MKGNLHHAHCSSYNLDEGGFIIVEMKEFRCHFYSEHKSTWTSFPESINN